MEFCGQLVEEQTLLPGLGMCQKLKTTTKSQKTKSSKQQQKRLKSTA